MTNKVKSLLYLACFIMSAIVYQITLSNTSNQELFNEEQVVEADVIIKPYTETEIPTATY